MRSIAHETHDGQGLFDHLGSKMINTEGHCVTQATRAKHTDWVARTTEIYFS